MVRDPDAAGGVRSVQDRLMDAAEQLVALHGESGASSRAITRAAGQRHNSAITYHFGSRRNLLAAVWQRGTDAVNTQRRKMLDAGVGELTLPELVDAWITPFTSYLDDHAPSYWARFNEEALRGYPRLITPELRRRLGNHIEEIPIGTLLDVFERMERITCDGRQPLAGHRVSASIRGVIATLAAWEREHVGAADRAPVDAEVDGGQTATELGEDLKPAVLAFLQAPATASAESRIGRA